MIASSVTWKVMASDAADDCPRCPPALFCAQIILRCMRIRKGRKDEAAPELSNCTLAWNVSADGWRKLSLMKPKAQAAMLMLLRDDSSDDCGAQRDCLWHGWHGCHCFPMVATCTPMAPGGCLVGLMQLRVRNVNQRRRSKGTGAQTLVAALLELKNDRDFSNKRCNSECAMNETAKEVKMHRESDLGTAERNFPNLKAVRSSHRMSLLSKICSPGFRIEQRSERRLLWPGCLIRAFVRRWRTRKRDGTCTRPGFAAAIIR